MTTFYANDVPQVASQPTSRPRRTGPRRDWLWVSLACALLATSGLVRSWQDRRFEAAKDRVVTPLFPLKTLPARIGKWTLDDKSQSTLDPQISQIAGAVDSLVRTYVDESTGVAVTVLILYGRAETAVFHVPEVCYPAIGYAPFDDTYEVSLDTKPVASRFRALAYKKEGGAAVDRQEVYYAFRHNGRWTPEVAGNWRTLRYSPAVFKIQTQRTIGEHERRTVDNPSEQFLVELIKTMEQQIADATAQLKTRTAPAS